MKVVLASGRLRHPMRRIRFVTIAVWLTLLVGLVGAGMGRGLVSALRGLGTRLG